MLVPKRRRFVKWGFLVLALAGIYILVRGNRDTRATLVNQLNGSTRRGICPVEGQTIANEHPLPVSPVSLVSGYYEIKSKHNVSEYLDWMAIFLLRVNTPLVVYTDSTTLSRSHDSPKTFASVVAQRNLLMPGRTFTKLLNLNSTPLAREFGPTMLEQRKADPERGVGHTYSLYLVWLLKVEALRDAAAMNVFCSEWFLWADIGSLRHKGHPYRQWPSPARLLKIPKDRVVMSLVVRFPKAVMAAHDLKQKSSVDAINDDHIAGTFILVNPRSGALDRFYDALQEAYRVLITAGLSVVKDQTVYNALYLQHPELFNLIPSPASSNPDKCWRYLQVWLNDPDEAPLPDNAKSCVVK